MHSLVHVISDLHLSAAPTANSERGAQMCSPGTQALLVNFIDKLPGSNEACDSHLVIAGDIVDFLAEPPFSAFTVDPTQGRAKLQRILDDTRNVWDALARFARQRGGKLTLMLGNHDVELSLPDVRRLLMQRIGGATVRFIYDNEAFTLGPLLVEHGNRFDAWNAVAHGALRRVRSQLSRRLPVTPAFPVPPGSNMVIDVINPLKRTYPFVDLLKPETGAALPIAAALGGVGLKKAWSGFRKFRAMNEVDYDEVGREPNDEDLIASKTDEELALWQAAQSIAAGSDEELITATADPWQARRTDALFAAFRMLQGLRRLHRDTFDVGKEVDTYLVPARRCAAAGFAVVVYGHTHLPKRVPLGAPHRSGQVYLNTGTWADVMCLPDGIWDADETAGRAAFANFAGDLATTDIAAWRRAIPTYARIDIDYQEVRTAQLHFADDDAVVTNEGLQERLTGSLNDRR